MSLLSVENLSFSIDGTKLLKNITFSLEKGSLTLVAGKNGSGKSMLLKCLKGLEKPDEGIIKVNESLPTWGFILDSIIFNDTIYDTQQSI